VVENRGGAGGNIAARQVAKADADGYTVLVTTSAYAVNPSLSANAGYSPDSDFKVAAIVATTPNLIVAAPGGGISSLADAVTRAKAEKLTYATAGVGTTPHLSAERIFRIAAKVDIPHVPHTGAGPALNAVMGGHIQLASVALPAAMELVKGGQVKPLAVTSAKRLSVLPDVPTTIEAGFGDREDATWVAFFLPAATPPDVIAKLNADVNSVLADAAVIAKLGQIGFAPVGGSQADAEGYVRSEIARWGEVIRTIGLKVD
jgi:tripartite-type tricarboxylate transporter receptor subunit TctC